MTRDVFVSVKSVQKSVDDNQTETIETICFGRCYERNGKLYISYDEEIEATGTVQNMIKVAPGQVEITKKGAIGSAMSFRESESYKSCYQTPYGDMMMDITTKSLVCNVSDELIQVNIEYGIDMNGLPLSQVCIAIQIRPRDYKNLTVL